MPKRYAETVRENREHMGTPHREWKPVAVTGFQETTDDRGRTVKLPTFAFPRGYGKAPTLFPIQSADHMNCELCATPIKRAFHIQNDAKRWTLVVGSECVTHFGEGDTGEKAAKKSVAAANREAVRALETAKRQLWTRYHVEQPQYWCGKPIGTKRVWGCTDEAREAQRLNKAICDVLGHVTAKDDWQGNPIWTDRQIANWIKKNGETAQHALQSAKDFLDRQPALV